jgi:hypothetical protein
MVRAAATKAAECRQMAKNCHQRPRSAKRTSVEEGGAAGLGRGLERLRAELDSRRSRLRGERESPVHVLSRYMINAAGAKAIDAPLNRETREWTQAMGGSQQVQVLFRSHGCPGRPGASGRRSSSQ